MLELNSINPTAAQVPESEKDEFYCAPLTRTPIQQKISDHFQREVRRRGLQNTLNYFIVEGNAYYMVDAGRLTCKEVPQNTSRLSQMMSKFLNQFKEINMVQEIESVLNHPLERYAAKQNTALCEGNSTALEFYRVTRTGVTRINF